MKVAQKMDAKPYSQCRSWAERLMKFKTFTSPLRPRRPFAISLGSWSTDGKHKVYLGLTLILGAGKNSPSKKIWRLKNARTTPSRSALFVAKDRRFEIKRSQTLCWQSTINYSTNEVGTLNCTLPPLKLQWRRARGARTSLVRTGNGVRSLNLKKCVTPARAFAQTNRKNAHQILQAFGELISAW